MHAGVLRQRMLQCGCMIGYGIDEKSVLRGVISKHLRRRPTLELAKAGRGLGHFPAS